MLVCNKNMEMYIGSILFLRSYIKLIITCIVLSRMYIAKSIVPDQNPLLSFYYPIHWVFPEKNVFSK